MPQDFRNHTKDKRLESGKLMTQKQKNSSIITIAIASILALLVCLLPTLITDAILLMVIQVLMVSRLGTIFKQSSVLKGVIVAMAATFIGRTLVEIIPIIGWVVSAIVGPVVTGVMGWGVACDLADRSRKEWERRMNAEDAANAYAKAEYYKRAANSSMVDDDSKAEDFRHE